MASRIARKPKPKQAHLFQELVDRVSLPAVLSFLKETRGTITWTVRDLATTLNMSPAAAKSALAILEIQGYVKLTTVKDEWTTTPQGEAVSGSKSPRYSPETIERSLAALADRLKLVNQDSSAEYKITDAVAFGDFLSRRARVQAAYIGIKLEPRNHAAQHPHWASEHERQQAFLKQLRGRTPLVNVQAYAEWMSARRHRNLLDSR